MLELFLTISAVCALYLVYLYLTERRKNEALREHLEVLQEQLSEGTFVNWADIEASVRSMCREALANASNPSETGK